VAGSRVGDQVVDHTARLGEHQGVLAVALAQGGDVVGEHRLEEVRGAVAGDLDLPHVRHVEGAEPLADRAVLDQRALVAQRHLPAAEGAHPRPKGHVLGVQ
jgi:hypothetical protein